MAEVRDRGAPFDKLRVTKAELRVTTMRPGGAALGSEFVG